ncbi:hypothetical protein [Mucilaginibacter ginsenosidivorax]|uniref:Uncharacterized protein n=1 Tax=Mucilaginibacter ginsenosidivorax TaxID=862126 RepID=A0A5B8W9Y6_9SPHI|nr:hypothetical protein [Mucilaginibacter ginsenosidivorax]QEC79058.1 hypothetical protein FSB76_25045 [Mucilaginibacter ginsenosidivorax]
MNTTASQFFICEFKESVIKLIISAFPFLIASSFLISLSDNVEIESASLTFLINDNSAAGRLSSGISIDAELHPRKKIDRKSKLDIFVIVLKRG